jgi:phosphotransferase system enzyme I (PtsI)
MVIIQGIGIAPGVVTGKARIWKGGAGAPGAPARGLGESGGGAAPADAVPEAEQGAVKAKFSHEEYLQQFNLAVSQASGELKDLMEVLGPEDISIDILDTHLELLQDPQLAQDVSDKIYSGHLSAQEAFLEVLQHYVLMFEEMPDPYLNARADDLKDIGNRILKYLLQGPSITPEDMSFPEGTILIAEDLSPTDVIKLDAKRVAGIVTQKGNSTSHAFIIARAKGIPTVTGCGPELAQIADSDFMMLDGGEGKVFLYPNKDTLDRYAGNGHTPKAKVIQLKPILTVSNNGKQIPVMANASGLEDMEQLWAQGAEGIGLLRTEWLFMGRDRFPLKSKGKPVTIRTLDIGGDKPLPYFPLPEETNPFLGYRGIRISMDHPELFRTQVKAILRAAVFGSLRIMLPMIATMEELRWGKQQMAMAIEELKHSGHAFEAEVPVGIMIETPSAALIADLLAKEADFFSLGTNDLIQYTLAADRMNEHVRGLYDPFHPSLWRLLSRIVEAAHAAGLKVSMCGEMAALPLATLPLLGLGLDEFSVNPSDIPLIKNNIQKTSPGLAEKVLANILKMDHAQAIQSYLKEITS